MFWKKREKMVDIRELQKRGLVSLPPKKSEIITDREGFVELRNTKLQKQDLTKNMPQNSPINFFDIPSNPINPVLTEENEYSKREMDVKIEELDNKIYKLEQRIELLERKLNVGSSW